jgi:transglutaminase-like putative cysteine protease
VVERSDFFGNPTHYFDLNVRHDTLEVASFSRVEVTPPTLIIEEGAEPTWKQVATLIRESPDPETIEARAFVVPSPLVEIDSAIAEYGEQSFAAERPWRIALQDLCRRIFEDFSFDPSSTTVSTPIVEVFHHRRGVCQDFAHLAIAILRQMGLPARYVSGYIETDPPEGLDRLVGADASHAWVSTFAPGLGWVDLDPTNNLLPADRHIVLGWGRDYGDVTPLKGVVIGGGAHQLDVAVDVIPLSPTSSQLSR